MQDSRNYYKILQVSTEATIEEIKEAYRRLVRQYHPDLHPGNRLLEEKFKEICAAYKVLSDSVARQEYDQGWRLNQSKSRKAKTSPQKFYAQGIAKALEKNYQSAVKDYTKAIELNPDFLEAYIERGASRYKLGDARGALQDCNQALEIDPNSTQAYYYLGRARYRLGYTASAIKAYTQAIKLKPDHAQAYYYRGVANNDLRELAFAVEDWQQAAVLFSEQGDKTGYQLVQGTLKSVNKIPGKQSKSSRHNPVTAVKTLLGDVLKVVSLFIVNPMGGLLPAFNSLDKPRAAAVGIAFALIFDFCFIVRSYVGWQSFFEASIWKLMLVGLVPFATLTVLSAIARSIYRNSGSFVSDIFLAGAFLLPMSFLTLASSISLTLGSPSMIVLTVFACCYGILTLYSGFTNIANLSEARAALVVPVMLLLSGWLFYWAFSAIIL
ncbi:MAG: DnaJ domain-containing protein [Symploca sp. SIO3C6]|nr:DnaJ domain-containing protein [Symploca sp. SIO3C6]